jgi:DNA-binding response OmpR family regulator
MLANSAALTCLFDIKNKENVLWVKECEEAFRNISWNSPALVIVDDNLREISASEFIRRLISQNAFINVAVMSELPEKQFHKTYEGLGVLAQLPPQPSRQDILALLDKCHQVSLPI